MLNTIENPDWRRSELTDISVTKRAGYHLFNIRFMVPTIRIPTLLDELQQLQDRCESVDGDHDVTRVVFTGSNPTDWFEEGYDVLTTDVNLLDALVRKAWVNTEEN